MKFIQGELSHLKKSNQTRLNLYRDACYLFSRRWKKLDYWTSVLHYFEPETVHYSLAYLSERDVERRVSDCNRNSTVIEQIIIYNDNEYSS